MSSEKTSVDTSKGGAPIDEVPPPAVVAVDPRLLVREQGFAGYITEFKRRVKGGELGSALKAGANLNKLRSAYVLPGAQLHVGAYRIDLVGRFGIKAGSEPLGVLTFQGTDSVTVRVSRLFD